MVYYYIIISYAVQAILQPLRGHTLYTFAPSGWRPLQGLFILATAPAEFTVYGQKKPRGAISSHFDFGSTRFFSLYLVENVPMGARICICVTLCDIL